MWRSTIRGVRILIGAIGGTILGAIGGVVAGYGLQLVAMLVVFLLVIPGFPGAEWLLNQLSEGSTLIVVLRVTGLIGALTGLGTGIVRFGLQPAVAKPAAHS